jgi:hypothetical protein
VSTIAATRRLALQLLASAKVVTAPGTTKSTEFQPVVAEHQEAEKIGGPGNAPKNGVLFLVEA